MTSATPVEWVARTRCPVCDGRSFDAVLTDLNDWQGGTGHFAIVACRGCSVRLTDPYPSEATVSALYEARQTRDFDGGNGRFFEWIKDTLARREVRGLVGRGRPARLLDVGTGNGRFARAAASAAPGLEIVATDFHPSAPEELRASGLPVTYVPFDRLDASAGKFDVVLLRHVLEHVHDPIAFLRRFRERLAEGGLVSIEVPNALSGCGRLFRHRWDGWNVPRHVLHFTPTSLARVLAAAGLTGRIVPREMPKMGNTLQNLLGSPTYTDWHRAAGTVLHPLQLAIEKTAGAGVCLGVVARAA